MEARCLLFGAVVAAGPFGSVIRQSWLRESCKRYRDKRHPHVIFTPYAITCQADTGRRHFTVGQLQESRRWQQGIQPGD